MGIVVRDAEVHSDMVAHIRGACGLGKVSSLVATVYCWRYKGVGGIGIDMRGFSYSILRLDRDGLFGFC